jgi:hypothetical protein
MIFAAIRRAFISHQRRNTGLFLALCCNGNSFAAGRMLYFVARATRPCWDAIMDINASSDFKADGLAALFSQVSEASTREIEKLVTQLQILRAQLENAGNRIERDIAQYKELSQQTMQITAIISDSVNKLPDGTQYTHQPLH